MARKKSNNKRNTAVDIKCLFSHKDCFAYKNGKCKILKCCDFNGKDCAFYKTEK